MGHPKIDDICDRYGIPDDAREALLQVVQQAEGRRFNRSMLSELPVRTVPKVALPGALEDRGPQGSDADTPAGPPTGLTWHPYAQTTAREPAAPPTTLAHPDARYVELELLGSGGMGDVRRVLDRDLNRTLAMKVLRPGLIDTPDAIFRFIEEAQATAQLEHPSIVPVHDFGRLPDGRIYFTMKEVHGRTLRSLFLEFHALPELDTGRTRELLEAFRRVCEAVAYAHSRGVLHRDLKPTNVMVGDFGEVLVLDWGLAALSAPARSGVTEAAGDAARARNRVAGTPVYMSPEQARGALSMVGTHSDVYSLGAMLYALLSGRPPYVGSAPDALEQVRAGPPPPLGGRFPVPHDLRAICERAMARDPADRFPSAAELSEVVGAWLAGARKKDRALRVVAQAARMRPAAARLRAEVATARKKASRIRATTAPTDPIPRKRMLWTLEDMADQLELAADLKGLEIRQLLRGALTHQPDLREAHAALSDHYRRAHAGAEARGQRKAAARLEVLLRAHDTGPHAAWLKGDGALTIITEPPGVHAELLRYSLRDRQLQLVSVRDLGQTPVIAAPLPMGSYVVRLRAAGFVPAQYPVHIRRQKHWQGVPPGSDDPAPISLLRVGALSARECYVPAGWTRIGGDPNAPDGRPGSDRWIDSFVIGRDPITNREYIAFLDDLVDQGRTDEALRHAPQQLPTTPEGEGAQYYGRDQDGHFALRPDDDGDLWGPDWPVVKVDQAGAQAYADWLASRTGQPWRLPERDEWEKAARGVDARFFPWGDRLDPTFCCMRDSHVSRPVIASVGDFPIDTSPYGVRGMAGNTADWASDPDAQGTVRGGHAFTHVLCGGTWFAPPALTRVTNAVHASDRHRSIAAGFRLARSV